MTKNSNTILSGFLKSDLSEFINNLEKRMFQMQTLIFLMQNINLRISGCYRIDNVQIYGGR
jgi:hypothetical protein